MAQLGSKYSCTYQHVFWIVIVISAVIATPAFRQGSREAPTSGLIHASDLPPSQGCERLVDKPLTGAVSTTDLDFWEQADCDPRELEKSELGLLKAWDASNRLRRPRNAISPVVSSLCVDGALGPSIQMPPAGLRNSADSYVNNCSFRLQESGVGSTQQEYNPNHVGLYDFLPPVSIATASNVGGTTINDHFSGSVFENVDLINPLTQFVHPQPEYFSMVHKKLDAIQEPKFCPVSGFQDARPGPFPGSENHASIRGRNSQLLPAYTQTDRVDADEINRAKRPKLSCTTLISHPSTPSFSLNISLPKMMLHRFIHRPTLSPTKELVQLVHKYVRVVEQNIDHVLDSKSKVILQKDEFEDILAAQILYLPKNHHQYEPMIRVVGRGGVIPPRSHVSYLFARLIKWLIYTHDAFLKKLGPPQSQKLATTKHVLDWLVKECFNPSPNHSLPVFGNITGDIPLYNRTVVFLPLQRWVIDYLSLEKAGPTPWVTAAAIIGIWYKNTVLTWWETNFKNDGEFWLSVEQALRFSGSFGQSSETTIPSRFPSPCSKWTKIGNFQIYELEEVLPMSAFQHALKSDAQLPGESEKKMISEICQCAAKGWKSRCIDTQAFEGIRVLAAVRKRQGKCGGKLNVIKLLDMQGELIPPIAIRRKLNKLFTHIMFNHDRLQKFAAFKATYHLDNHLPLFKWLCDELLRPEKSLPVLGTFEGEIESFAVGAFGEIQRYLIDHFTAPLSNQKWRHISLSLMGYWYKNNSSFWKSSFQNDLDFWNFMVSALIEDTLFTAAGPFSL